MIHKKVVKYHYTTKSLTFKILSYWHVFDSNLLVSVSRHCRLGRDCHVFQINTDRKSQVQKQLAGHNFYMWTQPYNQSFQGNQNLPRRICHLCDIWSTNHKSFFIGTILFRSSGWSWSPHLKREVLHRLLRHSARHLLWQFLCINEGTPPLLSSVLVNGAGAIQFI